MNRPIYQQLASLMDAAHRCGENADNARPTVMDGERDVTIEHWREMQTQHRRTIKHIARNQLPSGCGWDNGTEVDLDRSTPNHLILYGKYHHMNNDGYYDGWTDHEIHVRPSLQFDFDLRVIGPNRNDIKDYLHEMFDHALRINASL